MDITIAIPSRGRAGNNYELSSQITLREILYKSNRQIKLLVPENEKQGYQSRLSSFASHFPRMDLPDRVSLVPVGVEGIGPTRQWAIDHCKSTDGLLMLDDDMYFYHRLFPGELEKTYTIEPMFQWVEEKLDEGYIHGGISARQGNNRCKDDEHFNTRVNNAHFLNVKKIRELGVRFDSLPVMEDFHFTLSLLTRGYPNVVAFHWAWNQAGSGAVGGCSEYRTKELQAQGAEGLKEAFPEFVKVKEKESKSGATAFAGTRKDVIVQWKKAYASAPNYNS